MEFLNNIKYLLIVGMLMAPVLSYGQSTSAKQKLEAAKIGLITQRLGLTPEQAQQFWPVYQQFTEQKRTNQQEFRTLKKNYNPETATEAETKQLIRKGQELKQNQLNLEKEYSDKLLGVINNKQLLSLRQAEDEFRRTILKRLEQRRNQQQNNNQQQQRQRNQERLKNKRQGN